MPRGGRRKGAGGRSKWKSGKTKTIRVPEILSERILEIARMLDEGQSLEDVTQSKTINFSGISVYSTQKGMIVYLHDLLNAGYKIRPFALVDKLRKDMDLRDE